MMTTLRIILQLIPLLKSITVRIWINTASLLYNITLCILYLMLNSSYLPVMIFIMSLTLIFNKKWLIWRQIPGAINQDTIYYLLTFIPNVILEQKKSCIKFFYESYHFIIKSPVIFTWIYSLILLVRHSLEIKLKCKFFSCDL